jgi:hypothetical protein
MQKVALLDHETERIYGLRGPFALAEHVAPLDNRHQHEPRTVAICFTGARNHFISFVKELERARSVADLRFVDPDLCSEKCLAAARLSMVS